jgi:hypothetical protein
MLSPLNLTGRWIGRYLQHGQEHPITAHFVQAGESLSGSMRDGHPEGEYALFQFAAEAGLAPGADEQIEANLRKQFANAPTAPIRYVTHLPPESVLESRRKGQTVSFLKSYQGTSFSGYKMGERLLGIEKAGHTVHYEGQLSADGLVIEGRWWIDWRFGAGHAPSGRLFCPSPGEGRRAFLPRAGSTSKAVRTALLRASRTVLFSRGGQQAR